MPLWMKVICFVLLPAGLVAGGTVWYVGRDKDSGVSLRTDKVVRRDLVATIGATGTVEPEELVDVGAQVAGQIYEFGKDAAGKQVDFGSQVEEGMVLAKIDDTLYQADLAQAAAQLQQA